MGSVGTVSGFCAETARKEHHAVSQKHALRYKDTKNTVGFVTKEKLLPKRSQATQNFLMK